MSPDIIPTASAAGRSRIHASAPGRPPAWLSPLVLLLAVAGLGAVSVLLGPDGNFDLRNYHYYAGWALFNKTVGFDLAPAQIQSYQHPLLDGIFYQVSRLLNDYPRVFTFVWAIPQGIAVWIVFHIARLVLAAAGMAPGLAFDALCLAAAFIGADGAVTVGVVGTSMSEAIPNACMMGGIWLALEAFRRERAGLGGAAARIGGAGLLAGAAAGLKLTAAPYLIGFGVATVLTPGFALRRRAGIVAALVGGAVLSLLVIGGPWWLAVYRAFGNPLFPYYNAIFHSPLYGNWNFTDDRFLPRNAWQWALYPLQWTLRKTTLVSEIPVRDARILVELLAAAALVVLAIRCRAAANALATWCALFVGAAYILWLRQFSILRYASGLETISGVVIVAALQALFAARPRPLAPAAAWATALLLLATTVYPTWERRKNHVDHVVAVSVHQVPPNALVLMLVGTPASYVAAFEPPSVRFVGLYSSLLRLDSTFGLQARVEDTIRTAPGEIWGLDRTFGFEGMADASLARYGLSPTGECYPIDSNIDVLLRLCRLRRNTDPRT